MLLLHYFFQKSSTHILKYSKIIWQESHSNTAAAISASEYAHDDNIFIW